MIGKFNANKVMLKTMQILGSSKEFEVLETGFKDWGSSTWEETKVIYKDGTTIFIRIDEPKERTNENNK